MTYRLEKIQIDENSSSVVPVGKVTALPSLGVLRNGDCQTVHNLNDIAEGDQVILASLTEWHRTSPISKILGLKNKGKELHFKTQTSTYILKDNNE